MGIDSFSCKGPYGIRNDLFFCPVSASDHIPGPAATIDSYGGQIPLDQNKNYDSFSMIISPQALLAL